MGIHVITIDDEDEGNEDSSNSTFDFDNPEDDNFDTTSEYVGSNTIRLLKGLVNDSIALAKACGVDDSVVRCFFENLEITAQLYGPKDERIASFIEESGSLLHYLLTLFVKAPDILISAVVRNNPDSAQDLKFRLCNLIAWIEEQQIENPSTLSEAK